MMLHQQQKFEFGVVDKAILCCDGLKSFKYCVTIVKVLKYLTVFKVQL